MSMESPGKLIIDGGLRASIRRDFSPQIWMDITEGALQAITEGTSATWNFVLFYDAAKPSLFIFMVFKFQNLWELVATDQRIVA